MKLAIAISRLSDLQKDQIELSKMLQSSIVVSDDNYPLGLPEDFLKQYEANQKEIARLSHNISITNFKTFDEDGTSLTQLRCREKTLNRLSHMLVRRISKDEMTDIYHYDQNLLHIIAEEKKKCFEKIDAIYDKIYVMNWKTELIEDE